uniref:Hikeshi-like domain-containing protein n=1 Tax=Leptocylindrus danicus TaxID=163516 RepID=A0A7S2LHT3_9STRA|mmetsp:Transcript_5359/g.7859  ORF Transcript_5359/g.7859 Transcript_5359/m.7859 type:complete len:189 (+) Transcript_5359:188-754(+)|eukprot:CAMPEP_0116026916 /NCGR_PEP_ID=MMETSP0321-20121206/14241_1 /TAXON_ID=163516 /ORGANISM="Leptocylindrus danicus var. danicus, Strain B650" /LENGTH=188 /DNA_ID=CAMNT_0003500017 /DNA_START=137 /DNA_END=703 /DNA_ORIENTATION=+
MSQAPQFGLVIPGRPVRTDFLPVDNTGLKYTLQIDGAKSVSDLVLFLLPGSVIPPDYGAVLYFQVTSSSHSGFELLGAVANSRQSGVFRTGWGQHEEVLRSTDGLITLGLSLEKLSDIRNLDIAERGVEDRGQVAKKIAMNLFNYLQSFDDVGSQRGMMTVPTNVFERWIKRFEEKFALDPNFFMNSG